MRLDRPFRGSEAIAAGHATRGDLRGPRFRRLGHDVYVLADIRADLDQAVRAALVRHPDGVVVGSTAAALRNALDDILDQRPGPVELAVPGAPRPAPGLLLRRDRLEPDEVAEQDGIRLATPSRTGLDVARRMATVDAVVV